MLSAIDVGLAVLLGSSLRMSATAIHSINSQNAVYLTYTHAGESYRETEILKIENWAQYTEYNLKNIEKVLSVSFDNKTSYKLKRDSGKYFRRNKVSLDSGVLGALVTKITLYGVYQSIQEREDGELENAWRSRIAEIQRGDLQAYLNEERKFLQELEANASYNGKVSI